MSDDLFRDFESQFQDVQVEGVEDVTTLNDMNLVLRLEDIDGQLYHLKELMHPSSQNGRELHSIRAAVVIELRKRGLM